MPAGAIGAAWAPGSWADTAWEADSWGSSEVSQESLVLIPRNFDLYGFLPGESDPSDLIRATYKHVNFVKVWDLRKPPYDTPLAITVLSAQFYGRAWHLDVEV